MTLAIGNIVRPSIGPHKNETHEVVHIFEDGHANIRPIGDQNLYEHGLVTCDPKYLTEEVITEEYQEPSGVWWHTMSKTAKESYRRNHPDAQGTFGQEPGSAKHHRLKANAHQKYANFHDNQMNHHYDKVLDHSEGPKMNSDKVNHHHMLKREHGEEFYHHHMKAAHHSALSSGATPRHQHDAVPTVGY